MADLSYLLKPKSPFTPAPSTLNTGLSLTPSGSVDKTPAYLKAPAPKATAPSISPTPTTVPLMSTPPKTSLLSSVKSEPAPTLTPPTTPPSPTPPPSSTPTPPETPQKKLERTVEDAQGGRTEYYSDGSSTYFQGAQKSNLPTPTPTIDSAMAKINQGALTPPSPTPSPEAPQPLQYLPGTEQAKRDEALQSTISKLTSDSNKEVEKIKKLGEQNIGASKGFLAKIGALGTTVSGAPVESGLGVLSSIKKQTDDTITEEENNLKIAIETAKTDEQAAIQKRLDDLNKLQQTNWENAFKIVEADNKAKLDEYNAKVSAGDKAATLEQSRYNTIGDNVFDTKTGTFITGPASKTTDAKNYEYYVQEQIKAGKPAANFDTWFSDQKAPAAVKEYNAAVSNGFKGSIIEYQQQKKGGTAGAALDADTLDFLARQYLTTGKTPSFGLSSSGSGATNRVAFYKTVADIARSQGRSAEAVNADQAAIKAATSTLGKVQQLQSTTQMAEQAAIKNIDLAVEYSKDYYRSGVPFVNKWKQLVTKNLGDTEFSGKVKSLSKFETALYTAAREYAKVASGAAGSVAGLTDSAMKEAENLLNTAMTPEGLSGAVEAMKADMANVTQTQKDQLESLKNTIENTGSGGAETTPTGGLTGYADKIKSAQDANYSPKEIVDFLSQDPAVKDKIQQARDAKYSDDDIIKTLQSFSSVGGDTNQAVARTDRHNNPTAFTTDIAKNAGLVEGVDYAVGDPFPDNPKLKTAKLLKDPIDTTIAVIDKIGFRTSSGKPRWTYIDMPKSLWNLMDYNQKKNVIAKMYKNEGGTNLNKLFA